MPKKDSSMHNKILILLLIWFFQTGVLSAQVMDLKRVSPESQGVRSSDVQHMFDSLMAISHGEVHGVMVLRHGKVIGELFPKPFAPEYHHTLYSASKTFVAAAVGIAIKENRLRLTDRLVTFFPELAPDTLSKELASITIIDLLTMTSGFQPDWNLRNIEHHWIRTLLTKEVKDPGETFRYDSMVSYLLSAIVQRVTGVSLLEYLKEHLFYPMHITDVYWEECPDHINTGGWGLYLQVESMAKFGQLLLNKGVWEGKQLLPAEWVELMTETNQETKMRDNYGFQLWHCPHPNAYRADGAFGQYIIVSPNEDMVVAITQANGGNGVYERDLVWNLLKKASDQPMQEGKEYTSLQHAQKEYALAVAGGKSNAKKQINLTAPIHLKRNKLDWRTIQIEQTKEVLKLKITTQTNETYCIEAGYQKWITNDMGEALPSYNIKAVHRMEGLPRRFKVAACYGWSKNNILECRIRYVNWITSLNLKIEEKKDDISISVKDLTQKGIYEIK